MSAYCTLTDLKAELGQTEATDDTLLNRLIGVASNGMELVTGRTFTQVSVTNQIMRAPDVVWGLDGVLRVRLSTPRITAVTALAYKQGTPAAAWTTADLTTLDYASEAQTSTVLAYLAPPVSLHSPLWVQISYVAGWAGTTLDPYPADLQEVCLWWALWLYRAKDAPFDKTANPMLGTITIPDAMPKRLALALARWKAIPVV